MVGTKLPSIYKAAAYTAPIITLKSSKIQFR